jgi:hypothetical protein
MSETEPVIVDVTPVATAAAATTAAATPAAATTAAATPAAATPAAATPAAATPAAATPAAATPAAATTAAATPAAATTAAATPAAATPAAATPAAATTAAATTAAATTAATVTAAVTAAATDVLSVATDPLGIAALSKEFVDSIGKIVTAAQASPATLPLVVAAETQRILMLLVQHQIDNFKAFTDLSQQMTTLLASLSKTDTTGLLASNPLLTSIMSNPLFATQLKQFTDVNAALLGGDITKLTAVLFPLLVPSKKP